MVLFDILSTASLASCTRALTLYVRLLVNNLHLAGFGCLCYLTATGLSHFHTTPDATLRFLDKIELSDRLNIPVHNLL